ncbi:MAG: DUF2726 domain-containing protein [Sulfurimonas sp.]
MERLQNIDIALLAGVALFVLILLLWFNRRERLHYEKVALFTPAEKKFLNVLDQAVGSEFRIYGKVRIADTILPKRTLSRKKWNRHFFQISSKHFDYVLCDKRSMDTLCAIELNDRSHQRRERIKRDQLVEKACRSANLPLVWIAVQKNYDKREIHHQIKKEISLQTAV